MKNNIKISTIITAGGSSNRFGSNKLLEKIEGKTVLETTIEKFLDFSCEIIIPISEETKNKLNINNSKIIYTKNGSTRQESVFNGLKCCSSPDYVLIHDGARPFIDKEIIEKTISEVQEKKAVVVGVRAIDTIKICNETGIILSTPKRANVFHAQTPQAFEYNLILNAHEKYKGENFTDDSAILENMGYQVYIVEGNYKNKKITTREDLNI